MAADGDRCSLKPLQPDRPDILRQPPRCWRNRRWRNQLDPAAGVSAFTRFLETSLKNTARHCIDGAICFVCMDWRHMEELLEAGRQVFCELKNLIVWDKGAGGMGTFYRSRHELIFAFKTGTASHINAFELGQHGQYRTNVWCYRGMNSFGASRKERLTLHPTVKPVGMIADAIKDVSGRSGIVLDLFGGSGSTLIAAHKTGRRGYLCEIDPQYCDRIIRRWQAYAHDDAILEATAQTFDEIAARAADVPTPACSQPSMAEDA